MADDETQALLAHVQRWQRAAGILVFVGAAASAALMWPDGAFWGLRPWPILLVGPILGLMLLVGHRAGDRAVTRHAIRWWALLATPVPAVAVLLAAAGAYGWTYYWWV